MAYLNSIIIKFIDAKACQVFRYKSNVFIYSETAILFVYLLSLTNERFCAVIPFLYKTKNVKIKILLMLH